MSEFVDSRLCAGGPLDGQVRTVLHGASFIVSRADPKGSTATAAGVEFDTYRRQLVAFRGRVWGVWVWAELSAADAVGAALAAVREAG